MDRFFATASRGTEDVLADELRSLGVSRVTPRRGGVAFGEGLEEAYRACLWSTVASRVLLPVAEFDVDGAGALYEGVHAIDWSEHLGPEQTLAVDAAGRRSPAGPPQFVVLKAKDAIVDRVRADAGRRPSVDTARPDLRVNLHLSGSRVTVSIDLSGRGLHRRGIERAGAEAPLKENLAAALLRIAGWPRRDAAVPFFDPFCGSGTILIEAAWMALDVACGLARERIGAEGWRGHDRALWARLRDEAERRRAAASRSPLRIAGSDASNEAVRTARRNLARAGLAGRVDVELRELREVRAPWNDAGVLVTNPPYGSRLGEVHGLGPLYELLGDTLRRRFPGWSSWVLCGAPALGKRIGLRPASRRVLYNGPIECRLFEIPISTRPPAAEDGPGWRRPGEQVASFVGRLGKNRRERVAWAEREGLTCYRLYDADVPEYNLSVDWYDGAVLVGENPRPRKVPAAQAARRLRDALLVLPDLLGVEPADVVLRAGAPSADDRDDAGERGRLREVREGDLRLLVDLALFPDAGLPLDQRLLRRRIRERAAGLDFLDLFARTCSAGVAAAAGGARTTTSLDPSKALLAWGRRCAALNGLASSRTTFERVDVLRWLTRKGERRFDMIHLAAPAYARSRGGSEEFDLARDHPWLLSRCAALLADGGEILFSTDRRRFELADLPGLRAREITDEVSPPDFARRRPRRAWVVERVAAR